MLGEANFDYCQAVDGLYLTFSMHGDLTIKAHFWLTQYNWDRGTTICATW